MGNEHTITYSPLIDGRDFFIKDKWGEELHFRIMSFMVPSGLLSTAIEVIDDPERKAPREYEVLSAYDADVEEAELRLKGKIKKSINTRYLTREYGGLSIKKDKLAGRFLGDCFEIDGLKLTPEEFIQTFSSCEGFKFTMKFMHSTD
jgi:hypothetical protein